MNLKPLPITCALAGLLSAGAFTARGASATITLANGATHQANIEGLGCSAAICSRVAIQGKAENQAAVRTRLDSLASIRTLDSGHALLVWKDGTQKRIGLIKDFRVLYLDHAGFANKVDLSKIKSIEFDR